MGQHTLSFHNPDKLEKQKRIDQNSSPFSFIKGKQTFEKEFSKHLMKDDDAKMIMNNKTNSHTFGCNHRFLSPSINSCFLLSFHLYV